jgi:lipoprotein signal peptidase
MGTRLELFFGDVATREKFRRFVWIAGFVIGLDLLTKLLALWRAPVEEPITLWGDAIEIRLMENATLLGTVVRSAGTLSQTFVSDIVLLALSIVGLAVTSARDRPLKKFLVMASVLLAAGLSLRLPVLLPALPSARSVGISRAFGVLAANVLLLRVVVNKPLFTAGALFTSAGLANLSTAIWHPAGVIDFIWFRPLSRVMGVANVADIVITFTSIALELACLVWLLSEVWWRITRSRRRFGMMGAFFRGGFTSG